VFLMFGPVSNPFGPSFDLVSFFHFQPIVLFFLSIVLLRGLRHLTMVKGFGEYHAMVAISKVAANLLGVGCMAILKGGPEIDIGIIGKRVHHHIGYFDGSLHFSSPSFFHPMNVTEQ